MSQNNKIDSLENILKTAKDDTNKIAILDLLYKEYRLDDLNKGYDYASQALILSQQLGFKKGTANSYRNLGEVYYFKGDYPLALNNFIEALKIRESLNDSAGVVEAYNNIGDVYFYQNDFTQTMNYYLKALGITEKLNDKGGMAKSYYNIGWVFYQQFKFNLARDYYLKSLKILEELDDKRSIASIYNSLGVLYNQLKDYRTSLSYHLQTLKIKEELKTNVDFLTTYMNIGLNYGRLKNYIKAVEFYMKGINMAKESGQMDKIKEGYFGLSIVSYENEQFKEAYEYHQLYSQIKDSIFNDESSKQITEMQTKYETEKKEQQIKLLNKDKEIQAKDLQRQKTIRNAVAGGLLLVLLFSFVLINRLLLIRKQKKVIETEREKSEKLLLNILPKDTADELKLNNAVTPKRYEQVTVMFTDFKGFTTIAEKMSAEELVSELDFIFKKFDEIISKYPIEKIKTIGDAYMCAGGLPIANTTNPVDVVLAALEIQEFMEKLAVGNLQLANEEKKLQTANWKLRIGIHTGSVIAGVVGDKKFAYDIWGDTVNTASRMESSGEPNKVNVSGTTYELIKNKFECIYRGEIEAKNKGKIKMYFVERKNS